MNTDLPERFEVKRLIGRGGMARVYLATDTQLQRDVAIKVLDGNWAEEPSVIAERFQREARLSARLNHINIVHTYDVGIDNEGRSFIVTEFIDGVTLADRLASDQPLAVSEVRSIVRELMQGLSAAHDAGLVHRDIKPANVLLTADGTVKIADFGIARADDDVVVTQTGFVVGTARYLSPEQARGGEVGVTSDLYSAAAVLYECVAGRPPFTAESIPELMLDRETKTPVPPSSFREDGVDEFDQPIMAGLAYAPDDRPQSATDFLAMFSAMRDTTAVLDAQGPDAPTVLMSPAVDTATDRSPKRRNARSPLIAVVVIAVALLGALLVGQLTQRGAPDSQDENTAVSKPIAEPVPVVVPPNETTQEGEQRDEAVDSCDVLSQKIAALEVDKKQLEDQKKSNDDKGKGKAKGKAQENGADKQLDQQISVIDEQVKVAKDDFKQQCG